MLVGVGLLLGGATTCAAAAALRGGAAAIAGWRAGRLHTVAAAAPPGALRRAARTWRGWAGAVRPPLGAALATGVGLAGAGLAWRFPALFALGGLVGGGALALLGAGQWAADRGWMSHTRSLLHLLVCFSRDPEISSPFVHAAYRDGD